MHKLFNRRGIEACQFLCSLPHAGLAGRVATGPLFSGVCIAWGYAVKWQSCLKKELKKKRKKEQKPPRGGNVETRGVSAAEGKCQGAPMAFGSWVTSAAFEGSVTKRGNYLAFASLERGDKRAKRHQKVINLASILSRRLWFSIRIGGTHFTSNQPLFAAPLQTGHERLVSGVERSQILKAPLSQTV